MRTIHKKSGVSLIELLAVIVILGILATIAIVTIGSLIENTRQKANEQIVVSLNEATIWYRDGENISSEDIFDGFATNGERISELFNNGYLSSIPQPTPPISFSWDIDNQEWILTEIIEGPALSSISYDFTETRLIDVIEDGAIVISGTFVDLGTSLESTEGILLIDNPKATYTINLTAQLSSGTYGGYGILFDTLLNGSNQDSGYAFQFDRYWHYGSLLIRERTNSHEGNPVIEIPILFDDNGNGDWVASGGVTNRQNPWWTDVHVITLDVSFINESLNSKRIAVYVDDIFAFQYDFISIVSSDDVSQNQVGLRSWAEPTEYIKFEIIES